MNLPNSENYPDDPDQMPPARRRRARRLLAPLDADERAAFLDSLAHRTSPTFDFFLFSLFAGLVLGIGLLLDSPALLLLGALLAPVMAPAVGVSFGTVTGSIRLFSRSLAGLLIGSLMVFAAGAVVGLISSIWMPGELSQARIYAQVSWINFIVMAVGAILTTASMVQSERKPLIPSVALAYTLFLPLSVAGFGLTGGIANFWPDGLVIYAVYLSWAALIGALTLAVLGFRPLTLFGYTLGGVMTLLGIILLIGISGVGAVFGAQMALPTPIPTPTFTLSPVPPTLTPTTTPVPPSATLPPTPTTTPTVTPTSTLSPTPTPVYAFINAIEGDPPGAIIRANPGGAVIRVYMNNTLLQVLPDTVELEGRIWAHVIVVADGAEGWILQSLLLIATPAPNW